MTGPRSGSMRAAPQGEFAIAPSVLGFGCASLGSRIAADAGLRALAEAHERGVNWFDVAPAYGAGEAETILARFIAGRRERLLLTTKVGIAPPARLGAIKRLYALGRPLIGAADGLRRAFRKFPATRNVRRPLSPELIESSIAQSLQRLGVDHVDVYALHDPDATDISRDDILRALENVVARGQARCVAVAGKLDACRAARRVGKPIGLVQMSVADLGEGREEFSDGAQRIVAHSVFGVDGLKRRVERTLARDAALRGRLVEAGYAGANERAAADLLLDYALALNPDGVTLTSMFDPRHLEANVARAARAPSPRAIELMKDIFARETPA